MRRTVFGAGRKFGPTLDCWRYCEMPQMRETGFGSCETGLAGDWSGGLARAPRAAESSTANGTRNQF